MPKRFPPRFLFYYDFERPSVPPVRRPPVPRRRLLVHTAYAAAGPVILAALLVIWGLFV